MNTFLKAMRHLVVRANKLLYRRFFSPEFKTSATLKVGFLTLPKPLPPASDLCADIRSTSSMTRILHNQEIGRFLGNTQIGGYPGFWGPGPQNPASPAGDPRIALPDPGIALFGGVPPRIGLE